MQTALALALAAALIGVPAYAQKVGPADIGGVVSGPKGPEAGVWVIAETTELPTTYAKIVVTQGALQRMGAWLWARRFAQGGSGAGQDAQLDRRAGAE